MASQVRRSTVRTRHGTAFRAQWAWRVNIAVDHVAQRLELCRSGRTRIQQRPAQGRRAAKGTRPFSGGKQGQGDGVARHAQIARGLKLETLSKAQFKHTATRVDISRLISQRNITILVTHIDNVIKDIFDTERHTAAF